MAIKTRLFFLVMAVIMMFTLIGLMLLQLRFYSMNDLSSYLNELDTTMGDLQSRVVSSLLLTTASSEPDKQQPTSSSDHQSTKQQSTEVTVRSVTTAVESSATPKPHEIIITQKDLRLYRFFNHLSNKTNPRNGVPILRRGSRKCRTMNAHQRIQKQSNSSLLAMSSVEFIGCCGLGHRLARMAAAAHVAMKLETALYGDWECCDTTDVFEALFGNEPIILGNYTLRQAHHYPDIEDVDVEVDEGKPQRRAAVALVNSSRNNNTTNNNNNIMTNHHRPHHIQFTYEVTGFDKLGSKRRCPCRSEKVASDYKFFSELRHRYKNKATVDDFVTRHFYNKTSIGMHIRAGNGETGDFKYKGRAIRDEAQFVLNVVQLIQHLIRNVPNNKPPILFIATDTEHFIETFRMALSSPNGTFWSNLTMQINNNTDTSKDDATTKTIITFPHFQTIPVVHLSQTRPPEGQGVLFGEFSRVASKGDACMNGWHGALQDQLILSHADIVLAPKVSSFTQTLPLSLTVGRQHYGSSSAHDSNHLPKELVQRPFCEGHSIETVKCYDSVSDWCCRTGGGKPTYFDINQNWHEWLL